MKKTRVTLKFEIAWVLITGNIQNNSDAIKRKHFLRGIN